MPLPPSQTTARSAPPVSPSAELTDDEREQRGFDARYRWLIRRELSQLAGLPDGDNPDALRELYARAAPMIRKDLQSRGFNPLEHSKRALEAVAFSTQKLRMALSQNLDEE